MADEINLSIEEVAKRLGVEEKTIGKYVREGKLKAVKNPINGSIVGFTEANIQEFLTGKPVEPKQEVKQLSDLPETLETKRQKELTTQTQLQNEEHKAKIEIDLRQKGYDSIEKGLADVEAKRKEVLELLGTANKERTQVMAELEAVARERQKIENAVAVVKLREEMVDKKRAEIMVIEEKQKEFIKKYADWRKELTELTEYHKVHIQPCVQALKAITQTIYSWVELLNGNTRYDWTRLYNYLGSKTEVLDRYVDHVNGATLNVEAEENKKEQA